MSNFEKLASVGGKPILFKIDAGPVGMNSIELKVPFDLKMIERIKAMGLSWKDATKSWKGELNVMNAWQLTRLFPESKPTIFSLGLLPQSNSNGWAPSPYLMAHQVEGAEIAHDKPRWCYWHETGVGKSALGIEIWKQKKVKTLVTCPLSIIEGAWLEDIKKFSPATKAVNIWKLYKSRNSKRGATAYESALRDCDIGIVNFDTFKSIRKDLERFNFQMLIVDESSFIKNPKAAITKEITKFADRIPYVYLLSGTPAPNSEMEFFSQVRLVDPFLFGRNFYLFKNEWFRQVDFSGFKWAMKPDRQDEFRRKVASVSHHIKKKDVLDLPERTFNIRKTYMSPSEAKAYAEMARKMVTEIENNEIEAANAAVKVMKLREITSGFLMDEDGNVAVCGDTKFKELERLLEEIGDRQVIIWIQFQYEARRIQEMLGDQSVVCNSSVKQLAQIENLRKFKEEKVKYLIAHPKSVGHGHTLTSCSDAIYFSLSYSFEQQTQSQDRIYRKGQKNACSYYYILADESIDEVIYRTLYSKEARLEETLNHVRRYK